jgi:PEGA domain
MRRIFVQLTVVVGLLAAGGSAVAQDQALEKAKQYFDQGQNLYLQGKYTEAAEQFMEAYNTKHFPAFLFNVAVCHEKNRDFVKALGFYQRYLKEDPHSQDKTLVVKRIKAIRKHLNPDKSASSQPTSQPSPTAPPNLPPVKTKGLVVIETAPEGAAIYLGDKRKGIFTRTPYTGSLPPGSHTVIIEHKRYSTERKTFTARADRMVYLYFALSLEKTRGWVEVKANIPGAQVYVESKGAGTVGPTPFSGWLRPGKQKITVKRDGYTPYVKVVKIVAGDVHDVDARLKKVTFGWLKVTGQSTQGAKIKVNGKPITCEEHPCRAKLSEGTYKVELERDGYKAYSHQLKVTQATETQLAVRLNLKPSRVKAYVSFGVAAALLGGAIATGVISRNAKDSLEEDLASGRIYDSEDDRITEGKVTSIIANSLFGVSGLVAALGVYYLFRDVGPDSYGETRINKIAVTPTLGPRSAGLSGQWRF